MFGSFNNASPQQRPAAGAFQAGEIGKTRGFFENSGGKAPRRDAAVILPPTAVGRPASALFESVQARKVVNSMLESANETSERGQAAAAVIEWATGFETTLDAFEVMAMGAAGIEDGSEGLTRDEVDNYNHWLDLFANAAVSLGADEKDVQAMIDMEYDSSARKVAADIAAGQLSSANEDNAIAAYAVMRPEEAALMESAMLEAVSVKVVRTGKITLAKKKPRRQRISSAQKSALKKAQLKAQTAISKVARAKSMKIRKARGL